MENQCCTCRRAVYDDEHMNLMGAGGRRLFTVGMGLLLWRHVCSERCSLPGYRRDARSARRAREVRALLYARRMLYPLLFALGKLSNGH